MRTPAVRTPDVRPSTDRPPSRNEAALRDLDHLARTLDSQWRVPLVGWRFGVDAVAGLIPGIGDVASSGISAYLIWRAARLGAPGGLLVRMVGNVAVDTIFGAVPLLGTVVDVYYKANNRNVRLLRDHLEKSGDL